MKQIVIYIVNEIRVRTLKKKMIISNVKVRDPYMNCNVIEKKNYKSSANFHLLYGVGIQTTLISATNINHFRIARKKVQQVRTHTVYHYHCTSSHTHHRYILLHIHCRSIRTYSIIYIYIYTYSYTPLRGK